MSDTLYIIFVIVLLIVIVIQHIYIRNLRKGIEYAVKTLKKFESAILMDDIVRKVSDDEFKTD